MNKTNDLFSIKEELNLLKEEYKNINLNNDEISKKILNDSTINELNNSYNKLVDNLLKLRNLTDNQKHKSNVLNKLKLYAKKLLPNQITTNISKIHLETKTLEEAINEMSELQEFIVLEAGKNLEYYKDLYNEINSSLNLIEKIKNKLLHIKNNLINLENNKEKEFLLFDIEKLENNFLIFESINKEILQTIEYQVITYNNLSSKTEQLRPIIMSQLRVQIAIAKQNSSLKKIEQAHSIIKDTLNDFIKINSQNTNEAIKDAIKLSNDNIIEEDTIKLLINNKKAFKKEIENLTKEIINTKNNYHQLIQKLEQNNNEKLLLNKI